MLARLRPIWPLLTLIASGAMLATAIFYFQGVMGLQPCPLCLDQRNWHWAVMGVSAAAFVIGLLRPSAQRFTVIAVGLVLLGSAGMGAYHVAVEQGWVIAQCDISGVDYGNLNITEFGNETFEPPKCDEIAWSWLGISMAGYNTLFSLLLALMSFAVALAPERKP